MNPLIRDDGENRAVRMFLLYYGGARGVTVGAMRDHMRMAGYPHWPDWVGGEPSGAHLAKAGAQQWLRHLFELEFTCVATVKENPHCPEGHSDELDTYLPTGTKLYARKV